MQPLGDKILIKPHAKEDRTKGGIIIPESAKVRPNKATVVFIPENTPSILVKPGDVVLLSPDAGAPVFHEDEEHYIVTYSDIWAII